MQNILIFFLMVIIFSQGIMLKLNIVYNWQRFILAEIRCPFLFSEATNTAQTLQPEVAKKHFNVGGKQHCNFI